jgi:hypothetical protein
LINLKWPDVNFWHMGAMHPIKLKIRSNFKYWKKSESTWKQKIIKYYTCIKMFGIEMIPIPMVS